MRLRSFSKARVEDYTANILTFQTNGRSLVKVYVLDDDLIRVCYLVDGMSCFNRIWFIVDENGQMPYKGRQRDELSPFSLPDFTITQSSEHIDLQIDPLNLRIYLVDDEPVISAGIEHWVGEMKC